MKKNTAILVYAVCLAALGLMLVHWLHLDYQSSPLPAANFSHPDRLSLSEAQRLGVPNFPWNGDAPEPSSGMILFIGLIIIVLVAGKDSLATRSFWKAVTSSKQVTAKTQTKYKTTKKTSFYGLVHAIGLWLVAIGSFLIGFGVYPDLVGLPKTYAKGYTALAGFICFGVGCLISGIAALLHGRHAADKT